MHDAKKHPRNEIRTVQLREDLPMQGNRLQWRTYVLLGILVLGGALRFWRITSGYPDLYVHDEIFEVNRALQLLDGHYDFYRAMKGFFFYLLSILYAVDGSVQVLASHFDSLRDYISYSIVHPGRAIIISRIASASLGTLSILLLYRVGRIILPRRPWAPELLLALAWATCGLSVWLAKWGFVETCLVFLSLLAIFPILKILEEGKYRHYLLAGIAISAATATKAYGILLWLIMVIVHIMADRSQGSCGALRRIFHKKMILTGVVFVLVWWALDPSIVVIMLTKTGILAQKFLHRPISDSSPVTHFRFYFNIVRWNIGNVLTLFFMIGLAVAFLKKRIEILAFATFSVIFLMLLCLNKETILVYPRYVLMTLPFLFITSVYGLMVVSDRIASGSGRIRFVIATLLLPVLFAGYVTWNGLESLLNARFYGTSFVPIQAQTKEWFERNVPAGTKIMMKGEEVWPGNQTIPLYALSGYYMEKYEKALRAGVLFKNMEALPYLATAKGLKRYDLIVVDRYEEWQNLDTYLQEGVEFFVIHVNQFAEGYVDKRTIKGGKSRVRFYKELKQSKKVFLEKRFEGLTLQGAPIEIEVYRRMMQ